MQLIEYFIYFIFFSFLGWCWEMVYTILTKGEWENRGFLYGPICPIYGFGGLLVIIIIDILNQNQIYYNNIILFLIFMVGSAILEYFTSYLMEKKFHARWWDYSDAPLNLNGRICLPGAIIFGIMGLVIVHYIFPTIQLYKNMTSENTLVGLSLLLMALLSSDLTLTVSSLTNFRERVKEVERKINEDGESLIQNLHLYKPIRGMTDAMASVFSKMNENRKMAIKRIVVFSKRKEKK